MGEPVLKSVTLELTEKHREYIGRSVTLSGNPAIVVADEDGWAWVASLNTLYGKAPFSWQEIYNACDNGGSFSV